MKKNKFCIFILSIIILFPQNIFAIKKTESNVLLNETKEDFDIPEISGKVDNLPWRNEEDFLKAKEKYDTPILMAGFCAVLKNPLPGEEYNVSLAAKGIKGKVINPSSIFSQNNSIGPYTEKRGFKEGASYIGDKIIMTEGGGVCKIATTLYNLVVLSNLEIVERHNHSMPINYVPYGQDATVSFGVKDFRFENTTDGNILIWSQLIENRLYMAFYGIQKSPRVTWNHEIRDIVEPSIKYVKNESLKKGEMKTVIEGLKGANVKSSITIEWEDGTVEMKNMGISRYLPLPKLIEAN